MNNYRFGEDRGRISSVNWTDGATTYSAPLDPDNRDYQQFLEDWKNGVEVLNADGTPAPYVAPETP